MRRYILTEQGILAYRVLWSCWTEPNGKPTLNNILAYCKGAEISASVTKKTLEEMMKFGLVKEIDEPATKGKKHWHEQLP
jgi:hypothetical protein